MKIIVGLGNPGALYQWTRHNMGFLVLDRFANDNNVVISKKGFHSIYGKGFIDSEKVLFVKPMTFMNRSGISVKEIIDFFSATLKDLLVIHDDLDLPFGSIRFKRKGGDGGHQGVRSIIEELGDNNFLRMKIGIGRPPNEIDPSEYVLSQFGDSERLKLNEILSNASEALKVFILDGLDVAMNRFQRRTKNLIPMDNKDRSIPM